MIYYLLLIILDQYLKYKYCTHKNFGIDQGILIKYPYIYNIFFLLYGYFIKIHPLMITGGISNLIDRILYGYVRDHLTIYPINRYVKYNPVYNLADIYITVGVLLYFY